MENQDQELLDPIIDPTVKKDPVKEQDNLTPDHPRFQELYAKYKDSERTAKALEEKLAGQGKLLDSLTEHNKLLDAKIIADTKITKPEPEPVDVSSKIKDLQRERRKLLRVDGDSKDYDRIDDLEDNISELKEQKLTGTFKSLIPDVSKIQNQASAASSKKESDKTSAQFISSNPWIKVSTTENPNPEYNENMRATAEGLDIVLLTSYPNINERYAEIKKRVEKQYNWRGKGVDPPPNLEVESGSGPKHKTEALVLTAEDEEILNRLFPGDSEGRKRYIEQKRYLLKQRG